MSGDGMTVLLVEDDPGHAELVSRAFREQAFDGRLVHVGDGSAALDYLAGRQPFDDPDSHPRPQVVLLDLRLPTVDGLEVLDAIKANESLSDIPVVVLSTSGAEGDVNRAYELGANGYVVKPMDAGRFEELVCSVRRFWLEWNHCPWS